MRASRHRTSAHTWYFQRMSRPKLPSLNEYPTLASLLDFQLLNNPNSTYASIVSEAGPGKAFDISYLEFGRATHRVAHKLRPAGSGADPSSEVVALIANCDNLTYITTVMGALRAGLTPYAISHRNSPTAVCHMLESTNCHRIVADAAFLPPGLLDSIRAEADAKQYHIRIDSFPNLRDIYPHLGHETASEPFEAYPVPPPKVATDDVIFYVHSSGSTGFPKSIPHTHRTVLHQWLLHYPITRKYCEHPEQLTLGAFACPMFHMVGIYTQICIPLVSGTIIGMFEPKTPALPVMSNPGNSLEAAKKVGANVCFFPPAFLEAWSHSEDAMCFLSTSLFVSTGGGPLSTDAGNKLVANSVKVVLMYGGTEFGFPVVGSLDAKNWTYLRFYGTASPRWIPRENNVYELQLLENDVYPLCIHNLPDAKGYATLDLFEKHPTEEGLWRVVGRADDVITLASAEKIVPIPMEGRILTCPWVQGAVMFGRGRSEVGILIEPRVDRAIDPKDPNAVAEFRNRMWPWVEEANAIAPAFGRIYKEMILLTSPSKPFLRAPKGTIMRKATLAMYEDEINHLYDSNEASTGERNVSPPGSWTKSDLIDWLSKQAADIIGADASQLDQQADLFAQGFDSITATFIRKRIVSGLRSSGLTSSIKDVSQNIVYTHSTISSLASALASIADPENQGHASETATQAIARIIAKYSATMPSMIGAGDPSVSAPHKATVLITGTTGGLGSYMLSMLLLHPSVGKVYAFNRKSAKASLVERQRDAFADKELSVELLSSKKLSLVEGDDSREDFGLDQTLLDAIRATCTHVIHNAWRLDFNLTLNSFEPNIRGTRNWLNLALTSKHSHQFRFIFISSVGVAQSWDKRQGLFPEEIDIPADVAVGGGYGESKYVSEQLLRRASGLGLKATTVRIGQISGGRNSGYWATTDWVPNMIKSSVALGSLPDAQGILTWCPMDVVAQTVLDVALGTEILPTALNVVHPKPSSWTDVMHHFSTALQLSTGKALPLACFKEWFAVVKSKATEPSEEDIKRIPAIKLLSWFHNAVLCDEEARTTGEYDLEGAGIARLSTSKAEMASETLRCAVPLSQEDVNLWIAYWGRKGLLN